MKTVPPATLHDRVMAGNAPTIIDVRDSEEFQDDHIDPRDGTVYNLPIRQYDDLDELAADAPDTDRLYVICWTGKCSKRVARALAESGYTAVSVAGGMEQWRAATR
jgi:rhodanese-related sulfurtransferase